MAAQTWTQSSTIARLSAEGGLNDFLEKVLQEHCRDLRTSGLDFHEISTVLLKCGRVLIASCDRCQNL
eukprot:804786-Amphidinium_carterae.1